MLARAAETSKRAHNASAYGTLFSATLVFLSVCRVTELIS